MNLQQMRYIIAIYQEKGIKKAAEKLYITQPALSQQLQRIEQEIGITLFDRSTAPLIPTQEGLHYINMLERILYDYKQEMLWQDEMKQHFRGKLEIGISPTRSTQFLPLLLPAFHASFPDIRIELHEQFMYALPELMNRGRIDLALMISEPFSAGFTFLPLLKEKFLLAVPQGSELDRRCRSEVQKNGYIDVRNLEAAPFITLSRNGHIQKAVQELFQRYKIEPDILLETTYSELAYELAGSGLGSTIIAETVQKRYHAVPAPVCYSLDHYMDPWILGIAFRRDQYISKAMECFISFTSATLKKLNFEVP